MMYGLYVALAGENKISHYWMDRDTGRLHLQDSYQVSGGVGPLAVDRGTRFMVAGIRSTREMVSLSIDPHSGALSLVSTIPLESDPCFIALDRSGRFLFSAYYGAGCVAVHRIAAEGSLDRVPVQWLETAPNAHAIQTDRSNRFAFVPHIAGPNLILQFLFDPETGHLTPNARDRIVPEERVGPRHFCFHPTLDAVYFVNEQGCSVTAYHLDPSNGTLTAFQSVSTLPEDFGGENTCAQIHIGPSGRFLYASNRGHDSIACFVVDPQSGRLTSKGQQPTEKTPRAFNLDPQGRFLFASGLDTGRLSSYRVDQDTGTLSPLDRISVGERPMWLLPLRLTG